MDTLSGARQMAITRNLKVEIRFYQLASSADANDKACRAVQLFLVQSTGKLSPITKVIYFSEPVIISDSKSKLPNTSTTSTLLAPTDGSGNDTTDYINTAAMWPVHGVASYQYVSFYFLPTGETNLDPTKNWFATFVLETDPVTANNLPANYITIGIDPSTGKAISYRP